MSEVRSRSFFCVFNNPSEHGYDGTPAEICERLKNEWNVSETRSGCWAYCISEKGLHHIHMVLCDSSGLRMSQIVGRYAYGTHFEISKGSKKEIEGYINKVGKYAEKGEKVIYICRSGEILSNDIKNKSIVELIESGYNDYDIIKHNQDCVQHIEDIRKARCIIDAHKYSDIFRTLNVSYVFGPTGVGKTRGVMQKYGFKNVYRHIDYKRGYFDFYAGQNIVIFDEFRSQIDIVTMLNYLDGYPLMLPARYSDKVAKFTEVYIISNINLSEQYMKVQQSEPATWKAFLRRIDNVTYYNENGQTFTYHLKNNYIYSIKQINDKNKVSQLSLFDEK